MPRKGYRFGKKKRNATRQKPTWLFEDKAEAASTVDSNSTDEELDLDPATESISR